MTSYYIYDSEDEDEPFKTPAEPNQCMVYFICHYDTRFPVITSYSYYYLDADDLNDLVWETKKMMSENVELNELILNNFKRNGKKFISFYRIGKIVAPKLESIRKISHLSNHFDFDFVRLPELTLSNGRIKSINYYLNKFEDTKDVNVDRFYTDDYDSDIERVKIIQEQKDIYQERSELKDDAVIVIEKKNDKDPDLTCNSLFDPVDVIDPLFIKSGEPQVIRNYLWDDINWNSGDIKEKKTKLVISYTKHGDESLYLKDYGDYLICSEIPKTRSLKWFLNEYNRKAKNIDEIRSEFFTKICAQFSLHQFHRVGKYIMNDENKIIYSFS